MTDPRTEPGADLAASLYVALGRLSRSLRQEVPHSEVGPSALSALVTLDQQGPLRIGALAEVEGIAAASMTRILNSLDALDLVGREPDPHDGRAQVVAITPAGSRLLASGKEAKLAALRNRLGVLSAADRERLAAAVSVLEQLGGVLTAAR